MSRTCLPEEIDTHRGGTVWRSKLAADANIHLVSNFVSPCPCYVVRTPHIEHDALTYLQLILKLLQTETIAIALQHDTIFRLPSRLLD